MTNTTWLDSPAAIDLDSLQEEAALQTRVDRKYLMPLADADLLLGSMAYDMLVLQIDGRREFGYTSVYFDTEALDAHHQSATRRRHRFKVRTRSYLDTGTSWIEVKTAGPRKSTVKQRQRMASSALDELGAGDVDFVARILAEGDIGVDARDLRPVLQTSYQRSTFLLPSHSARVTLDTDLEWRDLEGLALAAPAQAVLETKGGTSASPVDRMLWQAGHRPRALSKYATGLSLLHPELRANRWHRTLRTITAGAGELACA